MNGYEYINKEAYELFNRYMLEESEDKNVDLEWSFNIFQKIIQLEPNNEDPIFFYHYSIIFRKAGDLENSYQMLKKAFEYNEKYKAFETNILIGHLANCDLGRYHFFEKGEKSNDPEERAKEYGIAKKYFENALEYYFDPEDKRCNLLKELIRRCSIASSSKTANNDAIPTSSINNTFATATNGPGKSGLFILLFLLEDIPVLIWVAIISATIAFIAYYPDPQPEKAQPPRTVLAWQSRPGYPKDFVGRGLDHQDHLAIAEFGQDLFPGDQILVTGEEFYVYEGAWYKQRGRFSAINYNSRNDDHYGVKARAGLPFRVDIRHKAQ